MKVPEIKKVSPISNMKEDFRITQEDTKLLKILEADDEEQEPEQRGDTEDEQRKAEFYKMVDEEDFF
jgi:hypothetical protein